MKAYFLWTVTGPQVILTSCDLVKDGACLDKLAKRGISKFEAREVPIELVKSKYGQSYDTVCRDPKQTDELRVLDVSGERVLNNFSIKELGPSVVYEAA